MKKNTKKIIAAGTATAVAITSASCSQQHEVPTTTTVTKTVTATPSTPNKETNEEPENKAQFIFNDPELEDRLGELEDKVSQIPNLGQDISEIRDQIAYLVNYISSVNSAHSSSSSYAPSGAGGNTASSGVQVPNTTGAPAVSSGIWQGSAAHPEKGDNSTSSANETHNTTTANPAPVGPMGENSTSHEGTYKWKGIAEEAQKGLVFGIDVNEVAPWLIPVLPLVVPLLFAGVGAVPNKDKDVNPGHTNMGSTEGQNSGSIGPNPTVPVDDGSDNNQNQKDDKESTETETENPETSETETETTPDTSETETPDEPETTEPSEPETSDGNEGEVTENESEGDGEDNASSETEGESPDAEDNTDGSSESEGGTEGESSNNEEGNEPESPDTSETETPETSETETETTPDTSETETPDEPETTEPSEPETSDGNEGEVTETPEVTEPSNPGSPVEGVIIDPTENLEPSESNNWGGQGSQAYTKQLGKEFENYRESRGLEVPIQANDLNASAQSWADYMAATNDFRHAEGGEFNEIISKDYNTGQTPQDVIKGYDGSPAHKEIMNYKNTTEYGVGTAKNETTSYTVIRTR